MNESFILKVTIYKEFMTVTPYCIGIDLGNQNCVIFQAGGKNKGAVPLIYNQRRIFPTKTAFSTNPWREYACEEAERQEEFNPMGTLSDLKLLLSQSFGRFDKKKFPNINQEIISEKNEALKFKIQFKDGYQQIPIQQALAVIFTRIIEICKSEIPDIDLDTTAFVICVSPSWGVAERIIILEDKKWLLSNVRNVVVKSATRLLFAQIVESKYQEKLLNVHFVEKFILSMKELVHTATSQPQRLMTMRQCKIEALKHFLRHRKEL